MTADRIRYTNFRNTEEADISFSGGVNILWGQNAQGKTNALEGIYCFAAGKSFRGVHDRDLIRFGEHTAALTLSFRDERREQEMMLRLSDAKPRTMTKNGVAVRKTSEFLGAFRAVLFCPEHLTLVTGAPAVRRGFLDSAICQLRPAYLAALSDHARILKQRNALLKDDGTDEKQKMPLLDVLTAQMAETNTRIVLTRKRYLELLSVSVDAFLADMTGEKEHAELAYVTDEEYDTQSAEMARKYYEKCMAYAGREIAAGTSLHGCHRDDIGIYLNGREAKLCASQGQDRSIALAMKLGEGELSKSASGEYPVFLFDDVLSELDAGRQNYLLKRLDTRQVIITSCNEELFRGMDATLIRVENGSYLK